MRTRLACFLLFGMAAAVLAAAVPSAAAEYKTKHVFIVVMDGVRWMDTFGDPAHTCIPHLYNDLRPRGTLFPRYYNRGITVTRQGHSTIISGTWQCIPNGGPRLTMPSLFEYLRDERKIPPSKAWAVFGKGEYSFLPYSSHPTYGKQYAASWVCGGKGTAWNEGDLEGDRGVTTKVVEIMKQDRPDLFFINYGYTDHAGHIAKDVGEYQAAIRGCDEQMWALWNAIQADPYYKDTTTVFFTNDHGRHTNDFHGHGDHCEQCEHIMLLALGPDVKPGYVSEQDALEIDLGPTAAELLGVQTPLATGRVLSECLAAPLNLNGKQAVTDAARQAVEAERLSGRDLQQLVADRVLSEVKPAAVGTDHTALLLMSGMVKAGARPDGGKYRQFVGTWAAAHLADSPLPPAVGLVVLDLPFEQRRDQTPKLLEVARGWLAETPTDRAVALPRAAFVSYVASLPVGKDLRPRALQYAHAALALPAAASPGLRERATELWLLGSLLTHSESDPEIEKAFVVSAYPILAAQTEPGALWDDPVVSGLAVAALAQVRKSSLLREVGKAKAPADVAALKALGDAEAKALTGDGKTPRRPLLRALSGIKDGLRFSADLLRYCVAADGTVADGSPLARAAFLAGYERLDWRYGGSTWPGATTTAVGKVNMGPAAKPAGQ